MKPKERIKRLHRISAYAAELLRYGEEIFDDRLKRVVLEKDFTNLFKMQSPAFEREKSEMSNNYLEHCLAAAEIEEAGVMAIFKRRTDINHAIFNLLERRHIDLFRFLIRAASKYFPVIEEPR